MVKWRDVTEVHKVEVVEEAIRLCHHKVLCSKAADNLSPVALAHYTLAASLIAQAQQHMKLASLNSVKQYP